ncbi:MAG: mannose-1-phosphate guanylyltransferase [Candidatus Kapaibacteriota bacterium]|jgi:mannose-1-phosphate guanylyltransferase
MKKIAIMLAGGSGERFWPVSRLAKPKQLIPLNSEKTLIEEAVERVSTFINVEDIYVFTSQIIFDTIREVLNFLPKENIVPEPMKRNTAPALAYATSYILAKYGGKYFSSEILVGVFTSDQRIEPIGAFQKTVEIAFDYVAVHPKIATIGIVPSRPETAFGYIEVSNESVHPDNLVFDVKAFKEKPDLTTAQHYVESGNYFWNSGMFFWRLDTFLNESRKYIPEIYFKIEPLRKLFLEIGFESLKTKLPEIESIYKTFPDISIDYALMEKTSNIVVVKSLFDWDDIGSWDALDRTKQHDQQQNVNIGNNILIDTRNSIIYNGSTSYGVKVCVVGMDNTVVVVTDDAILVCAKDQVQKVKKCIEELKKEPNNSKYL